VKVHLSKTRYGVPDHAEEVKKKIEELETELRELQKVIRATRMQVEVVLDYFCFPRNSETKYSFLEEIKLFIKKEKTTYHHLNMLKLQNTIYHGNCWCPTELVPVVQERINQLINERGNVGSCSLKKHSAPPLKEKPPTYFETNKVTWAFQEIVNTYGVPRYKEINPGLFTIATFPFLFGVMFADIGHGSLVLAAGLYLILSEKKIKQNPESLLALALPARYLLFLQGIFSLYCGLIYNDFMSIPFRLFNSCYSESTSAPLEKDSQECVYPFGMDPGWYGVSNELTFMNSFKMKLSIILGVSHMLFGSKNLPIIFLFFF